MSDINADLQNIKDSFNSLQETKENVMELKDSLVELFKASDLSAEGINNIISTMPTLISQFKAVVGDENLGRVKCFPSQ